MRQLLLIIYSWTIGFVQPVAILELNVKKQWTPRSQTSHHMKTPSSARGNRQQIFVESPVGLRPHLPAERKLALGLQRETHAFKESEEELSVHRRHQVPVMVSLLLFLAGVIDSVFLLPWFCRHYRPICVPLVAGNSCLQ